MQGRGHDVVALGFCSHPRQGAQRPCNRICFRARRSGGARSRFRHSVILATSFADLKTLCGLTYDTGLPTCTPACCLLASGTGKPGD